MAPFTQKKWALGATNTTPAPDAIEFIRDQARQRPGEITLIALAPLSNIEALQRRDPIIAVCLSLDENDTQRLIIDTLAPQPSGIP
jgi:inosine-uridine nucleoside N-ribohydrolase